MRILQTTHLTKEYGQDASLVKALDDVSLSVEAGQFVAIIGTSGSGKSTLLNMLGGLDRPTGGTVKVDNFQLEDLRDEDLTVFRRQRIGFIFQNYNLIPYLTAYENIVLPVRLDGKQEDKALLREIVGFLDLEGKLASYPSHLSGRHQPGRRAPRQPGQPHQRPGHRPAENDQRHLSPDHRDDHPQPRDCSQGRCPGPHRGREDPPVRRGVP